MQTSSVSNKSFGLTVGIILMVAAVGKSVFAGYASNFDLILFGISFLLISLGLLFPSVLSGPNKAWMAFGVIAGKIVNPIVLFCLFILVVTPTGLLMRLANARPLQLRIDRNTRSYWDQVSPNSTKISSMRDQF